MDWFPYMNWNSVKSFSPMHLPRHDQPQPWSATISNESVWTVYLPYPFLHLIQNMTHSSDEKRFRNWNLSKKEVSIPPSPKLIPNADCRNFLKLWGWGECLSAQTSLRRCPKGWRVLPGVIGLWIDGVCMALCDRSVTGAMDPADSTGPAWSLQHLHANMEPRLKH